VAVTGVLPEGGVLSEHLLFLARGDPWPLIGYPYEDESVAKGCLDHHGATFGREIHRITYNLFAGKGKVGREASPADILRKMEHESNLFLFRQFGEMGDHFPEEGAQGDCF